VNKYKAVTLNQSISRLQHLIKVVRNVPEANWYMGWHAVKGDCGTVGCALGHASFDPKFNRAGLVGGLSRGQNAFYLKLAGVRQADYVQTAMKFFGLTDNQADNLFYEWDTGTREERVRVIKAVIKQQVSKL
jgi:hypothetical protein